MLDCCLGYSLLKYKQGSDHLKAEGASWPVQWCRQSCCGGVSDTHSSEHVRLTSPATLSLAMVRWELLSFKMFKWMQGMTTARLERQSIPPLRSTQVGSTCVMLKRSERIKLGILTAISLAGNILKPCNSTSWEAHTPNDGTQGYSPQLSVLQWLKSFWRDLGLEWGPLLPKRPW